ncbi:HU family DNA-binding protein [Oscillospiraceae bacterium PP1C4]
MNRKTLVKEISGATQRSQKEVGDILKALEDIVLRELEMGEQIHWGGFLRMWTVFKRPAAVSGKVLHEDTPARKLRYRMPCCKFGSTVTKAVEEPLINIAQNENLSADILKFP